VEHLGLQDEACGTNMLTRLVVLVRCLQVGGGVVFGLTASKLSWSTFKQNSYKSLKNTSTETISLLSCYSLRIGRQTGIHYLNNWVMYPVARVSIKYWKTIKSSTKKYCVAYGGLPIFN
jgi:hypothetical protein